jgi:hypothetical protein
MQDGYKIREPDRAGIIRYRLLAQIFICARKHKKIKSKKSQFLNCVF